MTDQRLDAVGFGTSGLSDEECVDAVRTALDLGYRHVDTAQMYENEAEVGEAIAASDVAREDVFLATKVLPSRLDADGVVESTLDSLDRLGVDAVDLLYVHWPLAEYDPEETLPAIDEAADRGLTRHVGLSNFTPALLEEAFDILEASLFAHQVESHPLLPQRELREIARERGHRLVAYSPLAQGEVLDHPVLVDVAEDLGATPAQVALAWQLDRGVTPIPQGRGDHVRENVAAADVDIDEDARRRIDGIEERTRVVDPDHAPWH